MKFREIGFDGVDGMYLAQASSCDHGNEPSSSVKDGPFLDKLRDY